LGTTVKIKLDRNNIGAFIVSSMDIEDISDFLAVVDKSTYTKDHFEEAAEKVKKAKKIDQENQLTLYGLYKQAMVGDVNVSRPWLLDMVGQAKWDAWKKFEGFTMVNAGLAYIYIVNTLLEDGENASSMEDLGEGGGGGGTVFGGMGVSVSVLKDNGDARPWASGEEIFDAITKEDLSKLQNCLKAGADVNLKDEDQMTPLHFAVDRGFLEAVQLLIDSKADVNAQDSDLQTPIMFAVTCEHLDIITVLKTAGADLTIKNSDGLTVMELEGITEECTSRLLE